MKPLFSERLFFKLLNEDDVTEKYISWLNDPEVNRYLEIRFDSHDINSCREFVSSMNLDQDCYLFGIYIQINNYHIGNIKLKYTDRQYKKANIGFLIGEKRFWGMGYASEAIKSISSWGFDVLALERIEAGCYDENLGAVRAFLKSGYVVEGYERESFELDGRRVGCFLLAMIRADFLKIINE